VPTGGADAVRLWWATVVVGVIGSGSDRSH